MATQYKVFLTLTHYNQFQVTNHWYSHRKNAGLGNMMFQIASAKAYAIKHNATLYVPGLRTYFDDEKIPKEDSPFKQIEHAVPHDFHFHMNESNESNKCIWDYPFHDKIHFYGYFENIANFDEYKSHIIDLFKPTQPIIQYLLEKYPFIQDDDITSIHIRRGDDYMQIAKDSPELHTKLQQYESYYLAAIDHMIQHKHVKKVFIFTNDPQYATQLLFENPKYQTQNIQFFMSDELYYVDTWMMSLIKNNIVSCSTMSWWGSYLNTNPDKYILYGQCNRPELYYKEWTLI
jgi:hypothetical protein